MSVRPSSQGVDRETSRGKAPALHASAMNELMQTIGRVRRLMPRNKDVMDLCDALEKELISSTFEGERQAMAKLRKELNKPKLSRAEIQRNYRRRQKEQKK